MMEERYRHIIEVAIGQLEAIVFALIVCAIIPLFVSCSRKVTQEVPVELPKVTLETHQEGTSLDVQTFVSDTLVLVVNDRGDTLRTDHARNTYKESFRVDSIIVLRRDSVSYPVYITKTIEKPYIPKFCYLAMGGMIAILLIVIIWIIRKKAHQH